MHLADTLKQVMKPSQTVRATDRARLETQNKEAKNGARLQYENLARMRRLALAGALTKRAKQLPDGLDRRGEEGRKPENNETSGEFSYLGRLVSGLQRDQRAGGKSPAV